MTEEFGVVIPPEEGKAMDPGPPPFPDEEIVQDTGEEVD